MANKFTTGNSFSTGDQVTADKLNASINSATFDTGAVDDATTEISSGAIIVKDAGITNAKLSTNSVTTAKITDSNVTKAKIENVANMKALGNVSGSAAAPAEVAILDEDNMASNSATSLATQQSIKAYADSKVDGTGAGSFTTLAASGDVTVDTTTLKVDSSNNRVGIGTASPAVPLDVNGQARVVGNLFVGTDDTTPNGMIEVYGGGTGQNEGGEIRLRTAADFDTTYNHYFIDAYEDDLRIGREGGADITLTSAGKVGIGTTSPGHTLDVSGEFRVNGGGTGTIVVNDEDSSLCPTMTFLRNGGGTTTNDFIKFENSGGEVAAINASGGGYFSGNVGIGTTSPGRLLTVAGDAEFNVDGSLNTSKGIVINSSGTNFESDAGIIQATHAGSGSLTGGYWLKFNANSADKFTVKGNGDTAIAGALSKGSGSFKIEHPLESKKDTHNLVHSFLEGPQADLLYRGRVDLVDGVASVNIDLASDMTDGTFVVLCRDVQSFTTNESGWAAVRSSVDGNILTIEAQDNTCTDSISWMVVGERQDQHMYDTEWTDENGKVIVEPLTPEPIPEPEEEEVTEEE